MEGQERTPSNDRRVFERVGVELPVTVLASDANLECSGTSCDVSARGVGVVCGESVPIGSSVEVWMKIRQRRDPFYTRGLVSWVRLTQDGHHRLGIVFEKAQLMELSPVLRM